MSILTSEEVEAILKIESVADYPQIDHILLPAINEFLKTATGKDWSIDIQINPLAKSAAFILLVQWFENPAATGKNENAMLIGIVAQLSAIAFAEKQTL